MKGLGWIKNIPKKMKPLITIPNTIIFIGGCTVLIYIFSFLFPLTDNAFVVNNIQPVAAQVRGYVTDIYVKNGDHVKKGQALLTVFDKPYKYTVMQLQADLAEAKAKFSALEKTTERAQKLSENHKKIYIKRAQDDKKYKAGYAIQSISLITLQNSHQETKAAHDRWSASLKQIEVDRFHIKAQKNAIKSIQAKLALAKVNLDLTIVRAQNNGIIQNLFLSVGTPININQPIFSLVDSDVLYIQANFNETDLRNVRKNAKVLIYPRMYLGKKIFHGVVESDYWGANRQLVDSRTQLQNVINENQWILLPQRLPVIIKITDPNKNYPLRVGSSAYVYIKTG